MKPDDDELTPLLRRWEAPATPAGLRTRIFGTSPASRWQWLLTGSIRVPVPAVAALLVLMAWWAISRVTPRAPDHVSGTQPVSLADFQPPAEMRVRIVGEWP